MGLIAQAKADIERITSDLSGFGVAIELIAPNGTIGNVVGLHTKIGLGVDTDGNMVHSTKAHVSFSESLLPDYPIRNTKGKVDLKGHKINVADSTGIVKNYIMQSYFPDETIGLISCIIEEYVG